MNTRIAAAVCTTLLAVLSSAAAAQTADLRVRAQGHEVGDSLSFKPTARAEAGVISNVFFEETDPVVAPVVGVGVAADLLTRRAPVDPTISNASLSGEETQGRSSRFAFGLHGDAHFQQFLSNEAAMEQSKVSGGINAKLQAFPQSQFSAYLEEDFRRHITPQNAETTGNLNRDVNRVKVGLAYQPNMGTMKYSLRYINTIDMFEDNEFRFADRISHLIGGRWAWNFLPVTQWFIDASIGFQGALRNEGEMYKSSSTPVRAVTGLSTVLTTRTTARARVGYGRGFYERGEDFNNVLYGAELGYRYSLLGRATLGYQYDFRDSVNGNFYRDHAIIGKIDQQLGLVLATLGATYYRRGYRGIPMSVGASTRNDDIVEVNARANYMYRDWLSFFLNFGWVTTDTEYRTPDGDDPSFTRYRLLGGVQAAF